MPIPTTTIVIGGAATAPPREFIPERLVPFSSGGTESFAFAVRGGALATADPYTGKSVTVTVNGTLYLTGVVAALAEPALAPGIGFVRRYQCFGLSYVADWVRHVDANDGSGRSVYNAAKDQNPDGYNATRAGRTVGQILLDVLTMTVNANALAAVGVGNYTGLPTTPTLPAATLDDLTGVTNGMNWIPPAVVTFGGDRLWSAVRAFLKTWAPNRVPRILPDGTIRVLRRADFTAVAFVWGTDPVQPSGLSRDTTECASHLTISGAAVAEVMNFATDNGGLSEAPFAHNGLTVAQAKAAWTPANFRQPGLVVGAPGDDNGTCTCPSTTTVTVTSANAAMTWPLNYLDQTSTGHQATIFLSYSLGTTITTYAERGVVSNTALAAGGTSTLTVDRALDHTNYDHYVITCLTGGASAVWTVYQLPAWAAAKVAPKATRSRPYRATASAVMTQISSAVGSVLWSSSGLPPYSQASVPVTVDVGTGFVHFAYPTFLVAGGRAPSIVRALVPIYTASNTVEEPPDVLGVTQYGGTFYTEEGVQRTLHVYVPDWRDPLNATAVAAWASDLFDSVKNTVREGTLTYYGFNADLMNPLGSKVSITGPADTTWESAAVPVVDAELSWGVLAGEPMAFTTTVRVSSRTSHLSVEQFLKPDRTGLTLDFGGELDMGGLGGGSGWQGALAGARSFGADAVDAMGQAAADLPDPAQGAAAYAARDAAGLQSQADADRAGLGDMGVAGDAGPAVAGGGIKGGGGGVASHSPARVRDDFARRMEREESDMAGDAG